VPKRWMLNPSTYKNGIWVWAPVYDEDEEERGGGETFEMYIGAEIRVRIKSIHFTKVTNTAKGVQAVTSMQGMASTEDARLSNNTNIDQPVRRRSSSIGLQSETKSPAMHIVASIREDGLGLVEWWGGTGEDYAASDE